MDAPHYLHFVEVRRIIRYLIINPHRGFFFPRGMPLEPMAYSVLTRLVVLILIDLLLVVYLSG